MGGGDHETSKGTRISKAKQVETHERIESLERGTARRENDDEDDEDDRRTALRSTDRLRVP
jgi:hypothetical protein